MPSKTDFGVLYGQRTSGDALLIYSSYEDSKASPKTGDFIVLTPRDEDGVKYLARVEAEIYDEDPIFRSQDKTLVAVHYARIAERELSERDKQKMFSYTYNVRILCVFEDSGTSLKFTTAVRKLPSVSYNARHLTQREVEFILNKSNEKGAKIGQLCIGEDVQQDKGDIRFDVQKLQSRRTMIFAQSGFGKTNLVKVLLYNMISSKEYGKLIFDLNGEYVLKGQNTTGLGDIDEQTIRENLVVYSDRRIDTKYHSRFSLGGPVTLNMHQHLTVGDILGFGHGFSDVMKSFLEYLDSAAVQDFIQNLDTYVNDPSLIHKKYPGAFGSRDTSAGRTIMGIRKRIAHLIEEGKGIHSTKSNLIENVISALKQQKTVVIDLSLKDSGDASIVATILMRILFEQNKEKYTSDKEGELTNTVVFVEEAQNVLSEDLVRSNANPFVRVAKEGRKFGLGLVAITQRPSAISEEIRTQAENFFAFHMGNSDDIKALVKSNINYDGVISKFLQTETIKGNLYMVSADQAFVLPIRVLEFEKLVEGKLY